MIIIIQEKDRGFVESRFGSIIEFKHLLYKSGAYNPYLNYVRLVELSEDMAQAYRIGMESIIAAFKNVVPALKQLAESFNKLIETIQSEPPPEKYMHPPEVHPQVMNIGKENTIPHVPKQKIHRNRNNC